MDERSPLGFLLLRYLQLVFGQQHLAESDPFDDTFGDDAHLFAFEGVVKEKHVVSFRIESIDLSEFGLQQSFVVLYYL